MNEIKETINTLRTCCDTIDQVNTNLVGAYQQLEQFLTSLEKANELAESWIGLWKNVSSEVKPYLNRHSNIIIPPKMQLIEEQPHKAQRVANEETVENLEEEEQIEVEEIKQSRKNNKRKRVEDINSNTTESKRRKGNSGKRGRK